MKNLKNEEFRVYQFNDKGICKAHIIADFFDELLQNLKIILQDSRELSIVKAKLEEACFFAKKGISADKTNISED